MKALLLLIFAFSVCGCTEEIPIYRNYPLVKTIQVVVSSNNTVTFKGSIFGSSTAVLDHGFIWSKKRGTTFINNSIISLGSKADLGTFEKEVNQGMNPNTKYYVKAYAKSAGYTVYGEVIEFILLN